MAAVQSFCDFSWTSRIKLNKSEWTIECFADKISNLHRNTLWLTQSTSVCWMIFVRARSRAHSIFVSLWLVYEKDLISCMASLFDILMDMFCVWMRAYVSSSMSIGSKTESPSSMNTIITTTTLLCIRRNRNDWTINWRAGIIGSTMGYILILIQRESFMSASSVLLREQHRDSKYLIWPAKQLASTIHWLSLFQFFFQFALVMLFMILLKLYRFVGHNFPVTHWFIYKIH